MKILLCSYAFYPSMGGIESVSMMLAEQFTRLGHRVTVVTRTPAQGPDDFPFAVVRNPKPGELFGLVRHNDVIYHNNISLQMFWPLLLVGKPCVVTHATWIGGSKSQIYAKRLALRRTHSIAISKAVAEHIAVPSVTIGNPYQDSVFAECQGVERQSDLVFLGRLVSDKGADTLLEAVSLLARTGKAPSVTIIGSGPEEERLKEFTRTSGITQQVRFVGAKQGTELAQLLNAHKIMVVPSRWREPFGVVALEGIACGCVVIASEDGGLIDAIGNCGVTFPNGNAEALAHEIQRLLEAPARIADLRQYAEAHLHQHRAEAVAQAYLNVFEQVINQGRHSIRQVTTPQA